MSPPVQNGPSLFFFLGCNLSLSSFSFWYQISYFIPKCLLPSKRYQIYCPCGLRLRESTTPNNLQHTDWIDIIIKNWYDRRWIHEASKIWQWITQYCVSTMNYAVLCEQLYVCGYYTLGSHPKSLFPLMSANNENKWKIQCYQKWDI